MDVWEGRGGGGVTSRHENSHKLALKKKVPENLMRHRSVQET